MPKKILLIDDDLLVIKSIDRYLKPCGYNIEVAQSGKEALEKIKTSDFNLIISDIRMPGMDGIETLTKIREFSLQHNKEQVPAIIITGYAGGDEVYRKARELGIVECIYKPFELDEFIGAIKKSLEAPLKYRKIYAEVDHKLLDEGFIALVKEFKHFLQTIKDMFDEFDRVNRNGQIDFIEKNKKEIFDKLDDYFAKSWEMVKSLERDRYIIHQDYYQEMLHPLLEEVIEINRHIYRKPLGYPGDYIMMNYIYDYNGNNNYLGKSSYGKLINNYTCNIPISSSNIKRKEFLKEKIIEVLEKKKEVKILSVACGSARELIELLREGKINNTLSFICLDFEKEALDYINSEINKIGNDKKRFFSIEYICRDITSVIRHKELKEKLKDRDLIYAFGIFDYLGDRMAARLAEELFQLLQKEGKLIICNASLENSSHRAYYELLGEWNMVYRNKEEMLLWAKDIGGVSGIGFDRPGRFRSYSFLSVTHS